MSPRIIRRKPKAQRTLPPGSLIFTGEQKTSSPELEVFQYDRDHLTEQVVPTIEHALRLRADAGVFWLNITGLHDTQLIGSVGQSFDLHPLILEDILNTSQRPKKEEFQSGLFLVIKILTYDEATSRISTEQCSLFLGDRYLLTFQERSIGAFEGVRERIRTARGRIRDAGPDYLAYALMDAVVDNYFFVLERIEDRIETLEEEVLNDPSSETLATLNTVRRELLYLRRSVSPLREVIGGLQRGEGPLVQANTLPYLKDLYDHIIQIVEAVDSYREMLSGFLDIHMNAQSNRMNEVMKTLTLFASIFIPLTFLAGVYGMNFDVLPEIHFAYSYPIFWLVALGMGVGMVLYFRRKNWL